MRIIKYNPACQGLDVWLQGHFPPSFVTSSMRYVGPMQPRVEEAAELIKYRPMAVKSSGSRLGGMKREGAWAGGWGGTTEKGGNRSGFSQPEEGQFGQIEWHPESLIFGKFWWYVPECWALCLFNGDVKSVFLHLALSYKKREKLKWHYKNWHFSSGHIFTLPPWRKFGWRQCDLRPIALSRGWKLFGI